MCAAALATAPAVPNRSIWYRGTATAALLEFQFSVCKEPTRDNVTAELLEQDRKLFPELWDGKAGVDRFHPSISLSLTKSLYINRLQQISK